MRFGGYRALNGLESPVSRTGGISLDLRSELESVVSCNANRATRMDHSIVRDPNIPEVPRFSSGLAFPFRPGSTIEDGGTGSTIPPPIFRTSAVRIEFR